MTYVLSGDTLAENAGILVNEHLGLLTGGVSTSLDDGSHCRGVRRPDCASEYFSKHL